MRDCFDDKQKNGRFRAAETPANSELEHWDSGIFLLPGSTTDGTPDEMALRLRDQEVRRRAVRTMHRARLKASMQKVFLVWRIFVLVLRNTARRGGAPRGEGAGDRQGHRGSAGAEPGPTAASSSRDNRGIHATSLEANDEEEEAKKEDKYNVDIWDIDADWLQRELAKFFQDPTKCTATEKEILSILPIEGLQQCENRLAQVLQYEISEFTKLLLKNRLKILYCARFFRHRPKRTRGRSSKICATRQMRKRSWRHDWQALMAEFEKDRLDEIFESQSMMRFHTIPPSVLANALAFSPSHQEIAGPMEVLDFSFRFRELAYDPSVDVHQRFTVIPGAELPSSFQVSCPIGTDPATPWNAACSIIQSMNAAPLDHDAVPSFEIEEPAEYEAVFEEDLKAKVQRAVRRSAQAGPQVVRQAVGTSGYITKIAHVDPGDFPKHAKVQKVSQAESSSSGKLKSNPPVTVFALPERKQSEPAPLPAEPEFVEIEEAPVSDHGTIWRPCNHGEDGNESRFLPLADRPPRATVLTAQCQPVSLQVVGYGTLEFDPLAPAQLLADFLSAKLYRGRTHVRLQVQGKLVPPSTLVGVLQTETVRMRISPLRGRGGKPLVAIENDIQLLLEQHGVLKSELQNGIDEVVLALGPEAFQTGLASKLPWSALKEQATKKGVRLVLTTEREAKAAASSSSSRGPDPLQSDDPWAKRPNAPKPKKGRVQKIVLSQVEVDSIFFAVNGTALPLVTLDALSRGTIGFAVTNAEEIQERLHSFLSKSKTSGSESLVSLGWADAATAANERFGTPLQPTCKEATRHSFTFLSGHGEVSTHALLKEVLDFPTTNPQEVLTRPAYLGRCTSYQPVRQKVAALRFEAGRPTDFQVPFPSVALDVRRWQKLARRLESLVRLLRKGSTASPDLALQHSVSAIWSCIRRSPISPRFSSWCSSLLGFILWQCPSLDILEVMYQDAKATATRKAAEHWAMKREHFSQVLHDDMATKNGSLAFKLLKDISELPVNEMKVTHEVKLAPQACTTRDRKLLKNTPFGDAACQVVLSGVDLGADISYSLKSSTTKRKTRISQGRHRLQRIRGLPLSRRFKCRLVLAGVWTQALHGAESARVPPATLHRLRSQAARAVSVHCAGMNPWVGASVGAPVIIDPEFHLLLSRVRLFRLCWKYLPQARDWLQNALHRKGRYRSVTRHLLSQLHELHWERQSGLTFVDQHRSFDLVSTPWKHLEWMLSCDWMFHVTGNFAHRKFCDQLDTLGLDLCRTWLKFPAKGQGLLLTQLTVATYTADILAKVPSASVHSVCPKCGAPDSRLHRTRDCPATASLRADLALHSVGFPFQEHHWSFGLWSEQPEVRPWQCHLDSISWPTLPDRVTGRIGFLFTDGSCAHPKVKRLRLAAAAVIEAHSTLLRGSFGQAAVRIAQRLLAFPPDQRMASLPADHVDMWSFFVQCAQHATARSHRVKWIPAHRDWRRLSGRDRVLAFFNDVADRAAKAALAALTAAPQYQQLVTSWFTLARAAFALSSFHLRVAWLFLGNDQTEDRHMPAAEDISPVGSEWFLPSVDVGLQRTPRFGGILADWLSGLEWIPSTRRGLRETTPLELLWRFIYDIGCLPPYRVGSVWGGDGAVVSHWLTVPSLPILWRSWLDSLREVSVNGSSLLRVGTLRADAAASWQLGFGDFHVVGRVALPDVVFTDLAALLRRAPSLCRLRLPSFW
eukprot:Skav223538  [mRNA]  locus=scaffold4327:13740:22354:- [translate_table: standard]